MAYSASDNQNVAIVLVQGSFQLPLVYKKLTDGLEYTGYPTFQPKLPTLNKSEGDEFLSKTLNDDTEAVEQVLERLVTDEGRKVVVVMHSYGGLVGSNAISKELSLSHRKAAGKPGGVIHLFYFAAFVLDEHQSVLGTFGESNDDVTDDGRCYMKNGAARLYNDLPEQEAAEWESRMIAQSYAVRKTEITRTAFRYIPSTYLLCEGDKAVPPKYQEMFAGLTGSELLKCDAGHSPMLSHTDMLVKHIVNAAEQAVLETQ